MKRTLQCLALLAAVLVIFSGCATSTLQTAKTTPKGKLDMMIGGTFMTEGVFTPEIGFKYGVSDRLDLGLRLFSLGFMGEVKLGIIQNQIGFNLAVLGGFGYSTFNFYSYEAGAIASIDTESIAPYASIKLRRFGFNGTGEDGDFFESIMGEFMISALGLCFFPQGKVSIFAEFNWFQAVKVFGQDASGVSQAILSGGIRLRI